MVGETNQQHCDFAVVIFPSNHELHGGRKIQKMAELSEMVIRSLNMSKCNNRISKVIVKLYSRSFLVRVFYQQHICRSSPSILLIHHAQGCPPRLYYLRTHSQLTHSHRPTDHCQIHPSSIPAAHVHSKFERRGGHTTGRCSRLP